MKARSVANANAAAVLDALGGPDEFPLTHGQFADNGNYLESNELAVRHGICGDPEQVDSLAGCLQLVDDAVSFLGAVLPLLSCELSRYFYRNDDYYYNIDSEILRSK